MTPGCKGAAMPSHLVRVRRALLSVSEKHRLPEFARALHQREVELVSTGGTGRLLESHGIPHIPIETLTGSPEMLDGRVKTLHPLVHGPILADRSKPGHLATLERLEAAPIDLVAVNLYPFEQTIAGQDASEAEAAEQIDVGGPTMLRAAAKNFAGVAAISHASQYDDVLAELERFDGHTSLTTRRRLAFVAFQRLSRYDAAICEYLAGQVDHAGPTGDSPHCERGVTTLGSMLSIRVARTHELRYGENPHQQAAVYADHLPAPASITGASQLAGKPMSYNNFNDAAAALNAVVDLLRFDHEAAGACVVKHTNPCGLALAEDAETALLAALEGDPMAAFGGVLASNRPIDAAAARVLTEHASFLEVVIAPAIGADATRTLNAKWPNVRLLDVGSIDIGVTPAPLMRSMPGGLLAQDADVAVPTPGEWSLAAGRRPDDAGSRAAALTSIAAKHLTSNAIAIGGPAVRRSGDRVGELLGGDAVMLYGAGAGQMDRVAACRLAIDKAGELARDAVAASDAFFPFPDGPHLLLDAGVTIIVHPGGSKRDDETFQLCEERGATCLITGLRHFRH
jgi:phosphoribosylaminoimidazolecarboxamide formyltransferase/IMP cyclohydrolase